MNKCKGCGIILQSQDNQLPGYTKIIDNDYCERCFKITNYNEHKLLNKQINNNELIEEINKLNMSTLFLVDLLSLNKKNIKLFKSIKGNKMLVITKMDIIPKNIDLFKLEKRIMNEYQIDDLIFYSSLNDFGKKHIIDYINFYHTVLIAGPTSSGKSTLINHLFNSNLTVSNYKNTTQDFITINVDKNIIVDVPGFNDDEMIDNIKQKGFIKPCIIKLKKEYELQIDSYILTFDQDVNITTYLYSSCVIKTRKNINKYNHQLRMDKRSDLIINNLGFIYLKNDCNISINNLNGVEVRNSIIGGLL